VSLPPAVFAIAGESFELTVWSTTVKVPARSAVAITVCKNVAAKFAVTTTLCCHAVTAKVELKFLYTNFFGAQQNIARHFVHMYM
jgi:hypothetical protein